MHEVARRRRWYKAKGINLQKQLDRDYLKRLATKLDGPKYGLKKKRKVKKPHKKSVDKRKRMVYDKFLRPHKRQKYILEQEQ